MDRPDRVVSFIADEDDEVARHALAAIGELPDSLIDEVSGLLHERRREAAAAAALLARQGERGARALLAATERVESLVWALVGLGQVPEATVRSVTGELPQDVEEALRPGWASNEEPWLGLAEGGQELSFLERQTVRHKPPAVSEGPEDEQV